MLITHVNLAPRAKLLEQYSYCTPCNAYFWRGEEHLYLYHFSFTEFVTTHKISTRYWLEGPGIESRWAEIFRTYPDRLRGPPSLLYNGYRVFPGGKSDRGVMLTTHPLLVPKLRKSWSVPPLTVWVLLGLLRCSLYLLPIFLLATAKAYVLLFLVWMLPP